MRFNRYAFALACAGLINTQSSQGATSPFESMQKALKSMDEAMASMFDSINKMQEDFDAAWKNELTAERGGMNIAVDQVENAVKVVLTGVQADQFDASFGDKELTIKAQGMTIGLSANHSLLSIAMNQEISNETADKDDHSKKIGRQLVKSSARVCHPISGPVVMEDASIDYAKDTKTLTITLPKKEVKKPAKLIPVTIK
jgi:HSP20 family molecular chaperone IbpA